MAMNFLPMFQSCQPLDISFKNPAPVSTRRTNGTYRSWRIICPVYFRKAVYAWRFTTIWG